LSKICNALNIKWLKKIVLNIIIKMEVVNQVSNGDQTKSKIVTLFIHYNQDDDLSKIFTVLNEFRTNCGLKFSHHRGQIFVSVRSEHLNELYKRQPFKSSKYSTKTTYTCDEETGNRLIAQKDSFLRMSYDNNLGLATFQSRTPQRVHYQLVSRVFRATNTTFDKDLYVVVPTEGQQQEQDQEQEHHHQHHQHQRVQHDQPQSRGGYKTRGRGNARVFTGSGSTDNSWTKVGSRTGPRTVTSAPSS
jgi:hypothetical protein